LNLPLTGREDADGVVNKEPTNELFLERVGIEIPRVNGENLAEKEFSLESGGEAKELAEHILSYSSSISTDKALCCWSDENKDLLL
jgi:hypothetical protein